MQHLMEEGIDAYVADNKFRQRDPRFADAGRFKEKFKKELAKRLGRASQGQASQGQVYNV